MAIVTDPRPGRRAYQRAGAQDVPFARTERKGVSGAAIVILSLSLVGGAFLLQGRVSLSLGDEGFLWEGVWKTLAGQVPIRDFVAYDPGRYYWCAAFMKVLGPGLISLRISLALFQLMGMTLGLLAASRAVTSRFGLTFVGVVLLLWMNPRWKIFEHSIAMAAVYFAVLVVENPDWKRHFLAGVFVGLAALVGRNHGLYAFLSFSCLISFLHWKKATSGLTRSISAWAMGLVVGGLPLLAMMLFVPGYFESNIDWLRVILRHGATNLSIPVPWPWRLQHIGIPRSVYVQNLAVGMGFVLAPVLAVIVAVIAAKTTASSMKRRSLLVAALFPSIFYLHHAFARADYGHLAQSIHPSLLACVGLGVLLPDVRGAQRFRLALAAVLLLVSAAPTILRQPLIAMILSRRAGQTWVDCQVAGDRLLLPSDQAEYIHTVERLVGKYVGAEEPVLIAPIEPALYPILGRTSPILNSYCLLPETEERQAKMIQQLLQNHVRLAIIWNVAIDGQPEMRFEKTYPLVWRFLEENFARLADDGGLEGRIVWKATQHFSARR